LFYELGNTGSDGAVGGGLRRHSFVDLWQWWEIRKHWHTEEFDGVVHEIIAQGNKPKAFSAFDLTE
jgi:hypothetical protein